MRRRLGQRLREARETAGLSQTDLANKLGTKQQQVSNWETRGVVPSDRHRRKLAALLGIDLADLMEWIADAHETQTAAVRRDHADLRNHYDASLAELRQIVMANREINEQIGRDIAEIRDIMGDVFGQVPGMFIQLRDAISQLQAAICQLQEGRKNR